MNRYNPSEIEPKWEAIWEKEGVFRAVEEDDRRPRFYKLHMFPYPSGDLHMGHAEAFAISDIIARYKWMQGHNVLHPIGWDGFGLPAENAAIQRGIHPKEWTYSNIEEQRRTFERYGMSFDWTRVLATCDPEYYRWTQWIFLKLYEKGLAYRKLAPANWCPKDQTVLANEQVIQGRCERCGTPVVRKDLTQWFFKITDYADRLLDDMELLEWSERVLTLQRNWIGRSHGVEVTFEIVETGDRIPVFTTRPDTLWGATFFAFAAEHPVLDRLAEAGGTSAAVKELQDRLQRTAAAERDEALSREGLALGVYAVNPVNGEKVPCFVAPYVLMEYGTGAVMGVPGHDQRDFEFAREHGLEIRVVIQPEGQEIDPDEMSVAWPHEGVMVNSGPFDGTPSPESIERVTAWLAKEGKGREATSYRLRDWLISRQRYWGPPIPIIYCSSCGEVPVPEEDLPVLLPEDVDFSPQGESPLAKNEGFVNVSCPSCGEAARRETDTMDTFVDSSWYFLRFASPHDDREAWSRESVERWLPVDTYSGGIEHAILHLLYSRFVVKALYDLGYLGFVEPFTTLVNQGMVIYGGEAMSKSRGNLVELGPTIEKWGADTVRLSVMFAGPVDDDMDWANVSVSGVHKWLGRVWRTVFAAAEAAAGGGSGTLGNGNAAAPVGDELRRFVHRTVKAVTTDYERIGFNVAIAKLMELTNNFQRALDAGVRGRPAREAAESLVLLLAPMAPHIAEELWREALGHSDLVSMASWPTWDVALAKEQEVVLIVQVDGKVRDRITVRAEATEGECRELALASERVREFLKGHEPVRVIVRAPKLVNVVTAD
ncbi:MAG TPA: leucine--tRNA ligase [Actinomycetota bacterium]|nr:leucine--tRNA ligase [Actinomycetota bacterium]